MAKGLKLFRKVVQGSAVLGLCVGTAGLASAAPEWAQPGEVIEKCAGVARAAMNDCGANAHSCAGQAQTDNDPNEWVYVPEGVCARLAGGTLIETVTVPAAPSAE